MSKTAKSIVAVVAGLIAIVVLSIGTDVLMRTLGIFPNVGALMSHRQYLLAFAYRSLISIFGCYLAARLAPGNPMLHALWLGIAGIILSAIGVIVSWKRPELGPHWYPIALVVVSLPCAWIGGKLGNKRIGAAE